MLKPKVLLQRKTVGVSEFMGRESALSEVQVTLIGEGTLGVTIKLYGTNDEIGRVEIGTFTLSGNNLVTDSDALERAFSKLQAEVITITGTNAEVIVTVSDQRTGV